MNHSNQASQFKRTNIKVIKNANSKAYTSAQTSNQINSGLDGGEITPARVRNVTIYTKNSLEVESSSLGPPNERSTINGNTSNSFRNLTQEPTSVRSINNKRQLTFGSVKKVINTVNKHQEQQQVQQPEGLTSTTNMATGAAKHKLFLPKKQKMQGGGAQGVQIEDGHRRRLQALVAAQHGHGNSAVASSAERSDRDATINSIERGVATEGSSAVTTNKRGGGETSTSTQGTRQMKVINKKMITMSTQKGGRNAAIATQNSTGNNSASESANANSNNMVYRVNVDKTSSSNRPSHLNLNFNIVSQKTSAGVPQTVTNYNHHSSALSRFNSGNGNQSVKSSALKQGGASVMQTHHRANAPHLKCKRTSSEAHSVAEHSDPPVNGMSGSHNKGNISIRQEISPNRTAFSSQPAQSRKFVAANQGGGLCHRRQQIIQDITDETSPQNKITFSGAGGYATRPIQKQQSDSSMKSLKQLTAALSKNKSNDLKKVFYAASKVSQSSPSNKSLGTVPSQHSSGGPPSCSQPSSQQQFTLTKKASLISQDQSASTSRERTLNFKLKKHGQHGQLQNNREKLHQGGALQIHKSYATTAQQNQQQQQVAGNSLGIPQLVSKRRPLVIRKNNFVLTKQNESTSIDSSGNAPTSTSNGAAHTITRVHINPLVKQSGLVQKPIGVTTTATAVTSNKLNMTLHSNTSGNRALNNTQKIGLAGKATGGHGVNSSDSIDSTGPLGKTLAAVNASIKKDQQIELKFVELPNLNGTNASNNGSSSHRKMSDPSLEKLKDVVIATQNSSQPPGNRLIKVNRSKKKLDTARRSRIQQLKQDVNVFDHSAVHQTQFSTTLQSQSRGIPQISKQQSNDTAIAVTTVKTKFTNPSINATNVASNGGKQRVLQVQTDFNATLPLSIQKPAGSVTIKAQPNRKKQLGSVEHAQPSTTTAAKECNQAGSTGKLKSVSNFASNIQQQQQNNGLRPVRLFNYATVQAPPSVQTRKDFTSKNSQPAKTESTAEKQKQQQLLILKPPTLQVQTVANTTGALVNFKVGGQPTPTSASNKSNKSLRRGQIFRKQTQQKSSQMNDESASLATSKEATTNGGGIAQLELLTHMTTPTDAQNVSCTQLPLKKRRSKALLSQRQQDSEKNLNNCFGEIKGQQHVSGEALKSSTWLIEQQQQSSSYFQSSQGDKVCKTSKPHRSGNNAGIKTTRVVNTIQNPQVMKQFDSDPNIARSGQQQKSANELSTMKNDNSELIVRKPKLITQTAAVSAEQIMLRQDKASVENENPNANGKVLKKGTTTTSKSQRKNKLINVAALNDKESSIGIEKGAKTVDDGGTWTTSHASYGGAAKGATDVRASVRRSLERVESIKNLHSHEDKSNNFDRSSAAVHQIEEQSDDECILDDNQIRSESDQKQIAFHHQEGTAAPTFDNKNLVLAAQFDSSRQSKEASALWAAKIQTEQVSQTETDKGQFLNRSITNDSQQLPHSPNSMVSQDQEEPLQPQINELCETETKHQQNTDEHEQKQQDQLRIQYNETLPPPGPSATTSNQCSGKVNKKNSQQALENKFSLTKASELTRDQANTADTSNRKTISNQRAYCNSSESRVNIIGTTFSFKSQTSPETQTQIPQFPMTPQQVLIYFSNQLTEYEKKEILDYPEIYFIGAPTAQKTQGSPQQQYNYGYDDETGDYKIITNDHIGYRFEIKSFLGKGSFGTAVKCFDHKNGVDVAIKVVKNKKKYYYQAGVELKILQFLKENDPEDIMNVIHLNDYVIFRKHLCIGFELMSMNLFEFLKINDFNGFDHNLIRRFAIQLLYALKYLKMFQIIHCDLKPENILLKESNKSGIKIIDFGSSTFLDERVYTYIQSRFYRAPEIMLGISYDCAIDMWSFGCIMAELYIGYPIFPGDSENDQMSRLMEMVGIPNPTVLSMSSRKDKFFTKGPDGTHLEPIMCKNSRGKLRKPMGKPLALVIGDEDPDFTDFVERCMIWNPHHRMTPDEALKHVWILKGLPPQVLIHHQKMHNIETPELPKTVLKQRNDFVNEQQMAMRAQEQQLAEQQLRQQLQHQLQHQQQEHDQQQNHQQKPQQPVAKLIVTQQPKTNEVAPKSLNAERTGKIRLKRTAAQAAGASRNNTGGQQLTHQPMNIVRAPMVLPLSHVVMQKEPKSLKDPANNLLQPAVYPGSTKSSQKNQ